MAIIRNTGFGRLVTLSNDVGQVVRLSNGSVGEPVKLVNSGGEPIQALDVPLAISGLQLWLDASDTPTVSLNGSTVAQWSDKSGNNRHALQSIAANQPTLVSNSMNGKSVIRFDGVDDLFLVTINVPETNYSQFIVFRSSDTQGCFTVCVDPVTINAFSHDRQFGFSSAGKVSHRLFNEETITSPLAYNNGNPQLASVAVGTGGQKLYVNGNLVASGAKTGSDFTTQTGMLIGGGSLSNPSYGYTAGDIAEIIIYNKILTDLERGQINTYLNSKYNIYA